MERAIFSLLFVAVFGFQPMFFSNQNTKFLHGVAQSGAGYLQQDWLANTVDPLPIFSKLIELCFQLQLPQLTFVIQGVLVFVFAYFYFALAQYIFKFSKGQLYWFVAITFFVFCPMIFEDIYWGFSKQYLITQYLQPSSFAVLYFPALYYFYRKNFYLSAVLMGVPGLFHAAFTLVGAILFLACFGYLLWTKKKVVLVGIAGVLFSVVMLPSVLHQIQLLEPTDPALLAQAMQILSDYRIPHHTNVLSIFRFDFIIKVLVIGCSVYFIQHRFSKWLISILAVGLLFTILYGVLNQNGIITVSTPWRFSVVVVPYAFLLLTGIVSKPIGKINKLQVVPILFMALFTILGVVWTVNQHKAYQAMPGMQTLQWLRKNQDEFANATFLVETREKYGEVFRLNTGLPIVVNWKSHPYKDVEVIEWYNRMQKAEAFYNGKLTPSEVEEFLKDKHVTHIVAPLQFNYYGQVIHQDEQLKVIQLD